MLPKEGHRPAGLILRAGIQVLLFVGKWSRQGRAPCSWALLFPSEQTWLAKLQWQCVAAQPCWSKIQANSGGCQVEWKLPKRYMHMKHTHTSFCRVTCRAQHQGRPSVSCSVVLLLISLWLFCVSSRQASFGEESPFCLAWRSDCHWGHLSSGWLSCPSFRSLADVEKLLGSQDFPQCL